MTHAKATESTESSKASSDEGSIDDNTEPNQEQAQWRLSHRYTTHSPLAAPAAIQATPTVVASLTPWVPMFVDDCGVCRPAPLLMSAAEVMALLRFNDTGIRFPRASLNRYRRNGLRSVRVGRRSWFLLPDVLMFLQREP